MNSEVYSPKYNNSWALVIGINDYKYASPLEYACNDAVAISKLLIESFDFPKANVIKLMNRRASKKAIMELYLGFANKVDLNDRIIVFFAGHGHTLPGSRGEVGFLIPVDGTLDNLSTLIRWDDLTKNSELIRAKHILFIMDACYGGLAIKRALPPGSMRFLKDMLQRYARQVLTAGKADEVVSDSGGPIANHSVFTGHLIEGLAGKAATADGVMTGNGVMSYVYEKVAKDLYSQQTPHYGFFDGDGDFIFNAPIISELTDEDEIDKDILVTVPSYLPENSPAESMDLVDITKQYLSDTKYNIKLYDLITQKLREIISLLSDDKFSNMDEGLTVEGFSERLKLYEDIMKEIRSMISCVAFWGGDEHHQLLNKILARISDNIESRQSGIVVNLGLRWYPLFLLLYSAGIASVASDDYKALSCILTAKVKSSNNIYETIPISIPIGNASADLHGAFKNLPGHERQYVPRSEYLYKLLQPDLDDLLFMGNDYEQFFDRFEIFLALVYADLTYQPEGRIWGPLGRFAWKYRSRGTDSNNYLEILKEAKKQKSSWLPLSANLFSGSYDRFIEIATKFQEVLQGLAWY